MNDKTDQLGKPEPRNKLVYYPLLGLGFAFLVGWFYLMRQLGFMEWLAALGPETYKGSFNMLAIMLWMTPALLLWKYYLRWLNQRHEIGGQYDHDRHDAMYNNDTKPTNNESDSEQSSVQSELAKEFESTTKSDPKEPR